MLLGAFIAALTKDIYVDPTASATAFHDVAEHGGMHCECHFAIGGKPEVQGFFSRILRIDVGFTCKLFFNDAWLIAKF